MSAFFPRGGRRRTDYVLGVSGSDDGAVVGVACADGSWGVGGVSGAADCGAAAGSFLSALVAEALRAAALRVRVFAAFRPAARCLRVAAALRAAVLRLRVFPALRPAARRFPVAAAFFPALFRLGLISSSIAIREWIRSEVACVCKTWLWRNGKGHLCGWPRFALDLRCSHALWLSLILPAFGN